jgi:DEAD/DEAH box helicase domain-containing protein
MYRDTGDGSIVVPDQALYTPGMAPNQPDTPADVVGAIGAVKTTDVLVMTVDDVKLPGPDRTVEIRKELLPAGISALWSLGEALRIAAATELDVGPQEIQLGLQTANLRSSRTARIFLCDSLDNGAGYCTHLAHSGLIGNVLERLLGEDFRGRWEKPEHRAVCDSSCPDCLRSYDNRQLHGVLDWRLAIDLAEAVVTGTPNWNRWLLESGEIAVAFVAAWSTESTPITASGVGDLWALYAPHSTRAVLLVHPLWRHEQRYFLGAQNTAQSELQREFMPSDTGCISLLELKRRPQNLYTWLCPR